MNKNRLAGAAVIIALAAGLAACSTTTESEPTAVEAAGMTATPTPTAEQAASLRAEFAKINATLDSDSSVKSARNICSDILKEAEPEILARNAKLRFADGDYKPTDADGTALVNIVKNNGFCVAA